MAGLKPKFSKSGPLRATETLKGGLQSGYNTSLYRGDPLDLSGGYFIRGQATKGFSALFHGVKFTDVEGKSRILPYWPAGTVATDIEVMYVPVSEDTVLEVVADGPVPQTALTQFAALAIGTGNPKSGEANVTLAVATLNDAAANLDFRIVGINTFIREDKVLNAWGAAATRVLVVPIRATNKLV